MINFKTFAVKLIDFGGACIFTPDGQFPRGLRLPDKFEGCSKFNIKLADSCSEPLALTPMYTPLEMRARLTRANNDVTVLTSYFRNKETAFAIDNYGVIKSSAFMLVESNNNVVKNSSTGLEQDLVRYFKDHLNDRPINVPSIYQIIAKMDRVYNRIRENITSQQQRQKDRAREHARRITAEKEKDRIDYVTKTGRLHEQDFAKAASRYQSSEFTARYKRALEEENANPNNPIQQIVPARDDSRSIVPRGHTFDEQARKETRIRGQTMRRTKAIEDDRLKYVAQTGDLHNQAFARAASRSQRSEFTARYKRALKEEDKNLLNHKPDRYDDVVSMIENDNDEYRN